jgi:DNA-binding response OmpR family regulator
VYDGAAALDAAARTAFDVIVLDRDLPVVHGDRVCRAVAGSGPRILMLTAAAGVEDRVDGLELRMTTSASAIATHCPLGRSLLLANLR